MSSFSKTGLLGELEQLVLLAARNLGAEAYAVSIRDEIQARTGIALGRSSVYVTLDRLDRKGYVTSRFGDPTPERGGKAKRCFQITPAGASALATAAHAIAQMQRTGGGAIRAMTRRPCSHVVLGLLGRLLPPEWRESIAGDLAEERARRVAAGRPTGVAWAVRAASAALVTGARLAMDRRIHRRPAPPTPSRRTAMDHLTADFRHALRNLRGHPSYAVTAILTFALGLGANVAVFNLANWLLLRPLPGVKDEGRLVTIAFGSKEGAHGPIAVSDFDLLVKDAPGLSDLAGFQTVAAHVAVDGGAARRVYADVVNGRYFDVLGLSLTAGRGFTASEGADESLPPVAVISDRIWQRDFAGAPDVVGRRLIVNRQTVTVIGVAARGYRGASLSGSTDLWMPIAQHRIVVPNYPDGLLTRRIAFYFGLVGRLAPGASIAVVNTQVESVRARLSAANPNDSRMKKWHFSATPGAEAYPWQRAQLQDSIGMLTVIAGLLLVLTCANVGNLMVARAVARRGEIATRLALGASRAAVARLLLAEGLLLSLLACTAAVAFAWVAAGALEGTSVLQSLAPLDRAEIDWRVLGYAMLLSTVVAAAAGVFPAFSGTRVDVTAALRETSRSHTGSRQRLRRVLTAAQVAVSLTLLIGAALLVRSMAARLAINPGFDASKVLTFSVDPGLQGYGDRPRPFYRDLVDRVRQVPGVRAAAVAWLRPSFQGVGSDTDFRAEGAPSTSSISTDTNFVSPDFFSAVGLPIVDGRTFSEAECRRRFEDRDAVILTESLARRAFGSGSAVGRRIVNDQAKALTMTVVGVVRDTRQQRLTAASSDMMFEPFNVDARLGWSSVIVGLAAPQETVLPGLRRALADVDPTLPMYDVMRVDDAIRGEFADDLLVMRLTLVFAALATLVAAVGLYGVLARGVSERRREFGIRVALGASPSAMAGLVTRDALSVLVAGVAAGVGASAWLARFLDSRLFGVARLDAASFAVAIGIIGVVMLASAAPAGRRAARVNAAEVVRE